MTLLEFGRLLRERLPSVLAGLLAGVGAALLIVLLVPPTYSTTISLYVSAQGDQDSTEAYQGAQLSQARVISYVELVTRPRVTRAVIDDLGLDTTPAELATHLSASSEQDSVLLDVTVADENPQEAVAIADAVGRVFPTAIEELERPVRPGATPPVAVRVVQPADEALRTSAGWPIVVAFGLLGGLVAGVALAMVRHATDTSVRSVRGLSEAVDVPLLAATYVGRAGRADLVPTRDAPASPTAESMRRLRTTLQYLDVDNPPHVLAIASTEPGEGKTTVACDLALALAKAGGRVLLIEADLRRPSIADRLGLERSVGLTSVLAGQVELIDAVQRTTFGADVLTSGALVPTPGELLASQRMRALLTEARAHYDHVVVDTAPLLTVGDTSALLPLVDGVLLLCRWRSTQTVKLTLSVQLMRSVSARTLGVVLTFVPARFAPEGEGGYGDLPTGSAVLGEPVTPTAPRESPRPTPEVRHAATLERKASHGR